jgi:hypothetical protein
MIVLGVSGDGDWHGSGNYGIALGVRCLTTHTVGHLADNSPPDAAREASPIVARIGRTSVDL